MKRAEPGSVGSNPKRPVLAGSRSPSTMAPSASHDQQSAESTVAGLVGAALAVTAWGSGTVLVKAISMGGLSIAVYRFLLHFLAIVIWMWWRGTPFTLASIRRSAFGGIALACDVAFFFSAVKATSVINATLIGALQPVLVGVIAARFFGERIRGRDAFWSVLALVGVAGVVIATGDSAVSSLKGDLLAVGALLAWSGYFVASKQSKNKMTPTEFTAGSALWAGALNLPLALIVGQDLSPPTGADIVLLLAMTFISGVVGHTLMNWSLVQIPLWVGSTFTLLIPVAASLMAWAFLDEPLTMLQIMGTAAVLGSLGAIVIGQSRPTRPLTAAPPD